ncbi:O-antigen ligase [Sinomicrobium oceani]|uniref:O-antigen ligase n=1 Tax=Sinomicrobium oceani TaxID=1150368 RepID=A0A1K1QVL7_9FLAO|nr:O-antigen ligase family protein [Sinomicrobium oceani]SFW63928.1 O-antigen ligase [Sinomicrobium oceani]
MSNSRAILKEKIFYGLLSIVFITIPFPKYSLNTQSIIVLCIYWLFYNSLSSKRKYLKENKRSFLIVSSLFWISLLGLFYTDSFHGVLSDLFIPFLIFPLIFFSVKGITKEKVGFLLDYFSIATIIASLIGLLKAFWLMYNGLGDYFYYLDFAKVLGIHTTYFSLFTCVSIIHVTNKLKLSSRLKLKDWLNLCAIIYMLFILYMISAKISFISLWVVLILGFVWSYKSMKKKHVFFGFFFISCLPLVFFSPNLQTRIRHEKASNINERVILWEAVGKSYLEGNIFLGKGTGDGHKGLVEEYKKAGYEIAAKNEYNAHNQFLEQLLYFGLIGLTALSYIFFYSFRSMLLGRELTYMLILVVFLLFMMSESLLKRHSGEVLFPLLVTIFLSTSKDEIK